MEDKRFALTIKVVDERICAFENGLPEEDRSLFQELLAKARENETAFPWGKWLDFSLPD